MRRLCFFASVALALLAFDASPAAAHASLVSSDPANNAQLPAGEPPAGITLTFTEGVQVPDGAIQVLSGSGDAVEGVGDAEHGDSSSIVVAGLPDLDDGTYIVNWHVVSEDAHPINGAFAFNVGEPSADSDAVAGLLDDDTGRGVGISFALTRALAFGAVLVLVGALVFLRIGWPEAATDRNVRAMVWLAWVVALVTAPLGIALQTAYVNRSEFSAAWEFDLVGDVLDTGFGRGWLARVVILLLAIPFVRKPGRVRSPFVTGAEVALGLALVASISIAGHARTGRLTTLATTADIMHLGAAGVWLGGLAVLAVVLCRTPIPRGTMDAARAFSQLAAPAIAVVVITGVVQSWRQLDGPASLLDTTYGRLLLAKLGLVIVILAAASASRAIVRGRIARPLVPVGPGAARVEADSDDVRDLRNSVVVEVVFAALVLVVTAVLVNTEPARAEYKAEDAAAAPAPAVKFDRVLRGEQLDFVVTVAPAIGGLNDLEIVTRTPDGEIFQPIEISASFEAPEQGIQAIDVPLTADSPGVFRGSVQLVPSEWQLEIKALVSDIEQDVVTATVPVR